MGSIAEKQVESVSYTTCQIPNALMIQVKTRERTTLPEENMEDSHSNFAAQNVLLNSLSKSESYKRKD